MALLGGPCLLLLTKPEFELKIKDAQNEGLIDGLHPESPAGHYIRKNQEAFIGKHLEFVDPYQGKGGFGASTAQFGLVYQFDKKEFSAKELLNAYWEITETPDAPLPSGADLVAQMMGSGICYWNREEEVLENYKWPFENLSFFLTRTGIKIPTHEHLKNLEVSKDQGMYDAVEKTREALKNKNEEEFLQGLDNFKSQLKDKNWIHENTLELLDKVDSKFAKGCGALGADILFIATEKSEKENTKKKLEGLSLEIIASEEDL